jgi:hypothetical protein
MGSIRIEELGDIQSTYNRLEVFQEGATSAFLVISVTEAQELCFTFNPLAEAIGLSQAEWERILSVAKAFLPKTIANEESFQRWFREQDQLEGEGSSQ